MHKEDYDIATIEQYLAGQLGAEQAARFEAQLATDEALKADTAQYSRLFDGLNALRSQAYRDKIAGWEADTQLAESRTTLAPILDGLAALRSEGLRDQMLVWEKAHQSETVDLPKKETPVRTLRPVFVRRLAVAASILLLICVGAGWYAASNYSTDTLVADYYRMPNIGNQMGGEQTMRSRLESRFAEAHQLMQDKSYAEALKAFGEVQSLSRSAGLEDADVQYYSDQVSWNRVLILMAQQVSDEELRAALDQVVSNPENEYREKAASLKQQIDSHWRRLARKLGF